MVHEPVLIATIAIGLSLAFVGGIVAARLGLPTIVGYLLAGMAIGPFTPGFVADAGIARELAEIGVILLMFGVGMQFSVSELLAVRRVAVPGALGQVAVTGMLGAVLGMALGWGAGGGLVLGLSLGVASTVVALRALIQRNELDSVQGRIALGWLIVEDLFTVVALVLLPTVAPFLGGDAPGEGGGGPLVEVALALGKAAAFAALMVVVGTRVVPALLTIVARQGSRELFTLAVLGMALGIAFAAYALFGVSFALGAFLAGVVVSESDVSHQAAADALPLRDAFAVLFFVSVGMLIDPAFIVGNVPAILAASAIVLLSNASLAFLIVRLFGYPARVGLTVGVSVAQVGEFSFILASMGVALGLLPGVGLQLVVAVAVVTITINAFLFRAVGPLADRIAANHALSRFLEPSAGSLAVLPGRHSDEPVRGHVIICGYGRVGRLVAAALQRRGFRYIVITDDRREVERLREEGVTALYGDAANRELLVRAHLATARVLVVAMRDPQAARLIVERARSIQPHVAMVVRTHSAREAERLRDLGGAIQAIHGELELAVQMTRYTLRRYGVSTAEAEAVAQGLRERGGRALPEGAGSAGTHR